MQTKEITVAMIHEDFNSASDRAVKEAQHLLDNPKVDMAIYAERFAKVGFVNCKAMKDVKDRAAAYQKAPNVIEAVSYFHQHYPFQKFITESEVEKLCKKYSLLLGESANYAGDIPEKNLVDIENFKLRKEDYQENSYTSLFFQSSLPPSMIDQFGSIDPLYMGTFGRLRSRRRGPSSEFDFLSTTPDETTAMTLLGDRYLSDKDKDQYRDNLHKPEFKIVAPHADFNTRGYEVHDGYKLVYDPIVLQPVKYKDVSGYLIVTAWGDEASDELVVNQINN